MHITLEMYSNKPHTLAHCWLGPGPLRKHKLRLMNNSRPEHRAAKLEALVLCLIGQDDLKSKWDDDYFDCFIDYSCLHRSWFKHQIVDVLSGRLNVWLLTERVWHISLQVTCSFSFLNFPHQIVAYIYIFLKVRTVCSKWSLLPSWLVHTV